MLENKVKQILGEYAFTIAALQHQVDELKEQLETLTTEKKDKK